MWLIMPSSLSWSTLFSSVCLCPVLLHGLLDNQLVWIPHCHIGCFNHITRAFWLITSACQLSFSTLHTSLAQTQRQHLGPTAGGDEYLLTQVSHKHKEESQWENESESYFLRWEWVSGKSHQMTDALKNRKRKSHITSKAQEEKWQRGG